MKCFIDCGTHFEEGLDYVIDKYNIDYSWKVISFEANPYTYNACNKKYNYVDYYNLACSTYNGVTSLKVQDISKCRGYEFHPENTGEGSTIVEEDFHNSGWAATFTDTITVNCIDLCSFVQKINSTYLILKMDIEGSEFPILQKMKENNILSKINNLIVEFHPWIYPNKYNEYINIQKNLIDELIKNNVNVEIHG